MTQLSTSLAFVLLVSATAAAQSPPVQQPAAASSAASPDINTPRPIEAVDTVMMEEMTWMEIRDAMRAGKKTVIVPTGGIEQNGPYLTTGKHNFVLRATAPAIAFWALRISETVTGRTREASFIVRVPNSSWRQG